MYTNAKGSEFGSISFFEGSTMWMSMSEPPPCVAYRILIYIHLYKAYNIITISPHNIM